MADAELRERNELTESPHAAEVDALLEELGSSELGLSVEQAQRRLSDVGPNKLPEPGQQHVILRFFSHFKNVLIYILLGAAVLKAIYQDWLDFAVILIVAIATAAIGFIQEGQAEKALAGIRNLLSLHASVKRDNEWGDVSAEELVPGDIVRIQPGDKVPADIRLISANNLEIDESALTGESVPASKSTDLTEADVVVGDRTSMAFSGTVVSTGSAVGLVTGTASNTEIGKIQSMISDVESIGTPLTQQLDTFGKWIAGIILAIAALMTLFGWVVYDNEPAELVDAAITFAVAAVPEGLPAIVTITLALGVQQMAGRQAITRKLTAVETLGQVTTICSDKTGTLTYNEMTVRGITTPGHSYSVTGDGYRPRGTVSDDEDDTTIEFGDQGDVDALVTAMVRCNDAGLREEDDNWSIVGTPTEGSLIVLGRKFGADFDEYERLAELPFDSDNKFMAVLDRDGDGETVLFAKGAPDQLLDRSSSQRASDGSTETVDHDRWNQAIDQLGAQGLRVLAAASAPVSSERTNHESGSDQQAQIDVDDVNELTFLGVVGIVDPPRDEAIDAIAECQTAGIKVTMVTGDHASTAAAISEQLGIPTSDDPIVVTGTELQGMDDEELARIAPKTDVFARTSPEHKIRIVSALQSQGQVVAMTGDGVNDAPALAKADVGVAMGINGTEATKEAAEIVLGDDNFATIRSAVAEGRRIYDNIQKSLIFILPTTFGQAMVVLLAVLFDFTPPLQPTQVLWVNLVTAVTLSLALAYEPAEPGVMGRAPRGKSDPLLTKLFIRRIVWVTVLITAATTGIFFYEEFNGSTFAMSQTTAVTMLVLAQVAYLFNSRFLHSTSLTPRVLIGNKVIWISIATLIVLQLAFTYLPFMQTLFHTTSITWREWAITAGLSVAIFVATEIEKAIAAAIEKRNVSVTAA